MSGLERIAPDELDAERGRWDALVARAVGIDRFCSSTWWILPHHAAFEPDAPLLRAWGEHGACALAEVEALGGARVLTALEATWAIACPVPALRPEAHAREVAAWLRDAEAGWDLTVLSGVPDGSVQLAALARRLSRRYRLVAGEPGVRHVADLSLGVDAYLGRRTRNLRRTARRARERCHGEGIAYELLADTPPEHAFALHDRLLAVEARSWKGLSGVGADVEPMRSFYRLMMPRLAQLGKLRVLFARRDGTDVGYVLGAVDNGVFRGLQFSFDAEVRALSLGNAMQVELMERLVARDGVVRWDLGSGAHYKARWSDRRETMTTLIVVRR